MHSADYAVARGLSVCPSVCHTPVFCVNSYRYPQSFFSPSGSPTILVFPYQTGWQYSDGDPPNGSVKCNGGMKQEAQLSQRDRATLLVIEHFAMSLKITQGHSKRHC